MLFWYFLISLRHRWDVQLEVIDVQYEMLTRLREKLYQEKAYLRALAPGANLFRLFNPAMLGAALGTRTVLRRIRGLDPSLLVAFLAVNFVRAIVVQTRLIGRTLYV